MRLLPNTPFHFDPTAPTAIVFALIQKMKTNNRGNTSPLGSLVLVSLLSLLGPLVVAEPLRAQELRVRQVYGDSTLKEIRTAQTQAIYDRQSAWAFVLSRENLLRVDSAMATEIRGAHEDGVFHRMIATAWTTRGKYSVEFYVSEGTPIFLYEAFEYFDDAAPQESWRNFKGLAGWERRSYLRDEAVGYSETTGMPHIELDPSWLATTADRLTAALTERR